MNIVKALGCASVILLATSGISVSSTKAADLTETEPSWTGPYIGANVGYGWDSSAADISFKSTDPLLDGFVEAVRAAHLFPKSLSANADGVVGGGQLGYNWELSSSWVVGLEADMQASDIKGSDSTTRAPGFQATKTAVSKKIDWFGTVRARAGYLITPQWLLYATGGLAYGDTSLGFSTADVEAGCIVDATICGSKTSSGVKLGWTAGGGAEVMLSPDWSIKAEYLYLDLGQRSFETKTTTPIVFKASDDFHEHIVRVGLNYHFD